MKKNSRVYKRLLETHRLTTVRIGSSILVFLILCSSPLNAQVKARGADLDGTNAWIRLGFGPSSGKDYTGISGLASVHYITRYGIAGIRYIVSDTYGYEPYSSPSKNKIKGFREIGVLWGYAGNLSFLKASASIGAGTIWGTERISGSDKKFSTITLPIEVQLLIKPLPIVGIGVAFTTSVNTKSTLSSGLVVLQLGNLR